MRNEKSTGGSWCLLPPIGLTVALLAVVSSYALLFSSPAKALAQIPETVKAEGAKQSAPSVQPQTSSGNNPVTAISPVSSVSPEALQLFQTSLSTSQSAVQFMPGVAAVAAFLVVIISGYFGISLVRYGRKLEKIKKRQIKVRKQLKDATLDIGTIRDQHKIVQDSFATMETEMKNLTKEVRHEIRSLLDQKESIETDLKALQEAILTQSASHQTKSLDADLRLRAVQKLSQLVHPDGIIALLEIFLEPAEDDSLRKLAAYGLGRYAEQHDLRPFRGQILRAFEQVLSETATSDYLLMTVIQSAAKYGNDALVVLQWLEEYSKSTKPENRRVCAEAFGTSGLNDLLVIQRLKEMVAYDVDAVVRDAAETSLTRLEAEGAARQEH
jgi:hypothetical protein